MSHMGRAEGYEQEDTTDEDDAGGRGIEQRALITADEYIESMPLCPTYINVY